MKTSVILSLLLTAAVALSAPTLYKVESGSPATRVQFKSEATLETVIGQTQSVTGFVLLDGKKAESEIHVDLSSLKTGVSLRDEKMRRNHLETAKYPEAVFTLSSLELPGNGLVEGVRTRASAHGRLSLHGVTHEIAPETFLTLMQGGSQLRVESDFVLSLADYRISRPLYLMMRLSEEQKISVDITATSNPGGELSRSGDK